MKWTPTKKDVHINTRRVPIVSKNKSIADGHTPENLSKGGHQMPKQLSRGYFEVILLLTAVDCVLTNFHPT